LHTAIATLTSDSPYGQSRYHGIPRNDGETAADHDERTWRDRLNTDTQGNVFIPPMAFKNCISEAAKYLSMQVPGKGKSTYTKHFEAGVMVLQPLTLPIKKEQVEGVPLFVPSSGKRGDSARVSKRFPVIPQWRGEVEFFVVDDAITEPVFRKHLEEAGKFIGVGMFRPRNNGYWGRFSVEKLIWK
jgi:hypothetical protein